MLDVTAEMIADSLVSYREPTTARWILTSSDQDLALVCSTASWLIDHTTARRNGRPIIAALAVALAAVSVHEGNPRSLARRQRRRATTHSPTTDPWWTPGRRPHPSRTGIATPPAHRPDDACWAAVLATVR